MQQLTGAAPPQVAQPRTGGHAAHAAPLLSTITDVDPRGRTRTRTGTDPTGQAPHARAVAEVHPRQGSMSDRTPSVGS